MTLLATIYQTSLSDPPATSAISALAEWVSGLLFGPLATIVAVLAIAWIGFSMLSGRVDIRRGLLVLLGCFLLFGAQGIAIGLRSSAANEPISAAAGVPSPPIYVKASQTANNANGFDPYAGAAVTQIK